MFSSQTDLLKATTLSPPLLFKTFTYSFSETHTVPTPNVGVQGILVIPDPVTVSYRPGITRPV